MSKLVDIVEMTACQNCRVFETVYLWLLLC